MIDIQERSLCTFKQNLAPALQGAMQINHRVRHERRERCAGRQILLVHFAKIIRLCPQGSQDGVVLAHFRFELL